MRDIAVIDLGTNTFHLLIVRTDGQDFELLARKRTYVKLASGGAERISDDAFNRGLQTMVDFSNILNERAVDSYQAVATAALRTADNGSEFIQRVFEETGIGIELIDGFSEAHLISKGVELALQHHQPNYLIMDIGGGSVEFIHVFKHEVQEIWSFPVGVAYLYSKFDHENPIAEEEIHAINQYLEQELQLMLTHLQDGPPLPLVGASGTFEVLAEMCSAPQVNSLIRRVPTAFIHSTYKRMIQSSLEERYSMNDLPDDRADLIVVAMIMLHFILNELPINQLYVSDYALKEGVLISMIEQKIWA